MPAMDSDLFFSFLTVTVESLADHAGLNGGSEDLTDESRSRQLKRLLAVLQRKPRPEQDKIHAEFAAKHLPALVEKYRQNTGALNSSVSMLTVVGHTPYFVRFLRTPAGQGLVAIQAKRMAESLSHLIDVDVIGETCQFFSILLVLQGILGIDEADKTALLLKLRLWKCTYIGSLAAEGSERCLSLLTDHPSTRDLTTAIKDVFERSLVKCGAEGCLERSQSNGSPLLYCSRCRTAVYCGSEHQKLAWRAHKPICFPPTF